MPVDKSAIKACTTWRWVIRRICTRLLFAMLVFAATGSVFATAAASTKTISRFVFPADTNAVDVPLTRMSQWLLVPVAINGKDAGLFVVDTGASHLAIDKELADSLGLERIGASKANYAGGAKSMELFAASDFAVAGVSLHDTFLTTIDLSAIRREVGNDRINGLVGTTFLERMPFTLDWRQATLTLHNPASFNGSQYGTDFALKMLPLVPAIELTLEDHVTGWFIVDTGSNKTVSLKANFVQMHWEWLRKRPWNSIDSVGAGGEVRTREITLASVAWLGSRRTDVKTDYSMAADSTASRQGAGEVGMGLLQDFQLTFDYSQRKVWAVPATDNTLGEWDDPAFDPSKADLFGVTPLMNAAILGNVTYVERFLAQGVDVAAKDTKGYTALHYAARYGQKAVVTILLNAGADSDDKASYDQVPLNVAAAGGYDDMVAELLGRGATVDVEDIRGRTALIAAAERGHAGVVRQLCDAGAAIDHVSRSAGSALNAAVAQGYVAVARTLLDAGADPDLVDPYSKIPVIVTAATGGSTEAVRELINRRVNLNATNSAGQTALFAAAAHGHKDVVKLLLEAGVAPQLVDKDGLSALDYAASRGYSECMVLLYYGTLGSHGSQ